MAKKWMKFNCICGVENWIYEDPNSFSTEELIIYCYDCGHVYGAAAEEKIDDMGESCCVCIPFTGPERFQTNGPKGDPSMPNQVQWESDGKQLTREVYMKKNKYDPWTVWCRIPKNRNSPHCANWDKRCVGHTRDDAINSPAWKPPREKTHIDY